MEKRKLAMPTRERTIKKNPPLIRRKSRQEKLERAQNRRRLEELGCTLQASKHPQQDLTSHLEAPCSGLVNGESSKDVGRENPFALLTKEECSSAVRSQGSQVHWQQCFSPPYPQFPTPFRGCFFHHWPSKNLPHHSWPHPLFFCRPPFYYPLYYL